MYRCVRRVAPGFRAGLKRDHDTSPRFESIKPLDFVKASCCRGAGDRQVEVTPEVARERER